jgi:hypothetical protein
LAFVTVLEEHTATISCCVSPRGSSHIKSIIFLTFSSSSNSDAWWEASWSAGAIKAVEQHLERQKANAEVGYAGDKVSRRVRYFLGDGQPTVSIIIPTRDRVELLQACVQSLLEKTAYSSFEVILVDNGSRTPAALDYLASISSEPRIRVLRQDEV